MTAPFGLNALLPALYETRSSVSSVTRVHAQTLVLCTVKPFCHRFTRVFFICCVVCVCFALCLFAARKNVSSALCYSAIPTQIQDPDLPIKTCMFAVASAYFASFCPMSSPSVRFPVSCRFFLVRIIKKQTQTQKHVLSQFVMLVLADPWI